MASGLAVQAYQKRALPLIDGSPTSLAVPGAGCWCASSKGAYWVSPRSRWRRARPLRLPGIHAQGLDGCLLSRLRQAPAPDPVAFYPAFATHNAHTLAAIAEIAVSLGSNDEWEYQRLHGMGEELYDQVVGESTGASPAASMHRSARTRTCSPTSFAACSKTAPTLLRQPHRRRRPAARHAARLPGRNDCRPAEQARQPHSAAARPLPRDRSASQGSARQQPRTRHV